MRMVSVGNGLSTSTSAMAKCCPWKPPSRRLPTRCRVAPWPPSAPTTQPNRTVSAPDRDRRVTSTPASSWLSAVNDTPRSTSTSSSAVVVVT